MQIYLLTFAAAIAALPLQHAEQNEPSAKKPSFNSQTLEGATGALYLDETYFQGLDELGELTFGTPLEPEDVGSRGSAKLKTEPSALFSVLEDFNLTSDIAFEEEPYHMSKSEFLMYADLIVYEDIPKVTVEPETFDVPEMEDEPLLNKHTNAHEIQDGVEDIQLSTKLPRRKKEDLVAISPKTIEKLESADKANEQSGIINKTILPRKK